MKKIWKLSNYLFGWYWKKGGKVTTILSLCIGALFLGIMAFPAGNADSREYYAGAFRTYDMAIDGSFLPVIFLVGLGMVFLLQLAQMKGFSINGKGTYTLFTLPMKRKEIYLSFLLSLTAAVAVYYLLWLVLLIVAYFPVTALHEAAAAKEVLYFSEGVTLTGLDTHIQNGLFLAFRRSTFLSACFPTSLWHCLPLLVGLMLIGTGVLYASFGTERIGNCIVVSGLCVLSGVYFYLAETLHRLELLEGERVLMGGRVVLCIIALLVMLVIHLYTAEHLTDYVEL